MTQNIDIFDLKADLDAQAVIDAAAAKAAAEAAKAEAEAKARAESDERLRVARYNATMSTYHIYEGIADAMNRTRGGIEGGTNFVMLSPVDSEGRFTFTYRGIVDLRWWIDVKDEYTSIGKWSSKKTGRRRVTIVSYGSRQTLPQRKDGHFNYDAMAYMLWRMAIASWSETMREKQRRSNTEVAKEVADRLLPKTWGVIEPSATPDKPIRFRKTIDLCLTVEETEKLVAALQAAGIKF